MEIFRAYLNIPTEATSIPTTAVSMAFGCFAVNESASMVGRKTIDAARYVDMLTKSICYEACERWRTWSRVTAMMMMTPMMMSW